MARWHVATLLTAAHCLLYSPRRLRPHPRHVPDPLGIWCCRGGGPSCGARAGSCFQGALMGFARVVSGREKRRRAGANPPSPAGSFTGLNSPSSCPSGLSFPPRAGAGQGVSVGFPPPGGTGGEGGSHHPFRTDPSIHTSFSHPINLLWSGPVIAALCEGEGRRKKKPSAQTAAPVFSKRDVFPPPFSLSFP